MIKCSVCLKFSAFVDENRVCNKCGKSVYGTKKIDLNIIKHGSLRAIPYKQNKHIMPRLEWIELKKNIDKYYAGVSDDEIEAYNSEISTTKRKSRRLLGDEGYIYLLSSSVGLYKLGRTIDMEQRFAAHSRQWPVKLEVVHSIPVSQVTSCETFLLRTFKEKRAQGEWFSLSAKDISWICSLDTESLEQLVADALGI